LSSRWSEGHLLWIGLNSRSHASNRRPAICEVEFARAHGFRAIQFRGPEDGLDARVLGAPLATVAGAIAAAGLVVALEMLVVVDGDGHTKSGHTLLDVLHANLPAIAALPCRYVHWHAGALEGTGDAARQALEAGLVPQFIEGVAIAQRHGFRFAFEDNEPGQLYDSPEACGRLLAAVPGLELVWDLTHTPSGAVADFRRLIPRMSMLHVSDTPLPDVNHHLPLGLGCVDLQEHCRALLVAGFHGPAILEIGGHWKSGGFGRDTDEALIDSRCRLEDAARGTGEAVRQAGDE